MAEQIAFYAIFAQVIFCAWMVVSLRNLVHCALFLVLTFLGVAGVYVLLHADFLAGVQVLIYVGAITVLLLFGIMLTRRIAGQDVVVHNKQRFLGALGALALFWIIFSITQNAQFKTDTSAPSDPTGAIGKALVSTYVLPFELASIVLLVAMIGAIIIAREKDV
jgi:NADH-quinone oxidoreductase subunit J